MVGITFDPSIRVSFETPARPSGSGPSFMGAVSDTPAILRREMSSLMQASPFPFSSPNSAPFSPLPGGYDLEECNFRLGQRVLVDGGKKEGILKFYGPVKFQKGLWAGVELDDNSGKNNGSVEGVQYFHCPENHGMFVSVHRITHSAASPITMPRRLHGSGDVSFTDASFLALQGTNQAVDVSMITAAPADVSSLTEGLGMMTPIRQAKPPSFAPSSLKLLPAQETSSLAAHQRNAISPHMATTSLSLIDLANDSSGLDLSSIEHPNEPAPVPTLKAPKDTQSSPEVPFYTPFLKHSQSLSKRVSLHLKSKDEPKLLEGLKGQRHRAAAAAEGDTLLAHFGVPRRRSRSPANAKAQACSISSISNVSSELEPPVSPREYLAITTPYSKEVKKLQSLLIEKEAFISSLQKSRLSHSFGKSATSRNRLSRIEQPHFKSPEKLDPAAKENMPPCSDTPALDTAAHAYEAQIEEWKSKSNLLSSAVDTLKTQLADEREKQSALSDQKARLYEERLAEQEKQLSLLHAELQEKESQQSKRECEASSKSQHLEATLREKDQEHLQASRALEAHHESEKAELVKQHVALAASLDRQKALCSLLEHRNVDMIATKKSLEKELALLKTKLSGTEQDKAALNKLLESLQSQREQLNADHAARLAELTVKHEEEKTSLAASCAQESSALATSWQHRLEEEKSGLCSQIDHLQSELDRVVALKSKPEPEREVSDICLADIKGHKAYQELEEQNRLIYDELMLLKSPSQILDQISPVKKSLLERDVAKLLHYKSELENQCNYLRGLKEEYYQSLSGMAAQLERPASPKPDDPAHDREPTAHTATADDGLKTALLQKENHIGHLEMMVARLTAALESADEERRALIVELRERKQEGMYGWTALAYLRHSLQSQLLDWWYGAKAGHPVGAGQDRQGSTLEDLDAEIDALKSTIQGKTGELRELFV